MKAETVSKHTKVVGSWKEWGRGDEETIEERGLRKDGVSLEN